MRTSTFERLLSRPAIIWLLGAVALSTTSCTNSDAGARRAALRDAAAAQEQKPVKLRYYGGPKYPMYPE
jgi:hypothetical protein